MAPKKTVQTHRKALSVKGKAATTWYNAMTFHWISSKSGPKECAPHYISCSGCHNRYHRLGGLSNRNVFSRSSGGQTPIRVSARLVPLEGCRERSVPDLSPGLADTSSPCVSSCHLPAVCVPISPFYKDISHPGLSHPTLMTSFELGYLGKEPVSK